MREKTRALEGRMEEWVGGWIDGWLSRFKDCLQQSKNIPAKILCSVVAKHLMHQIFFEDELDFLSGR